MLVGGGAPFIPVVLDSRPELRGDSFRMVFICFIQVEPLYFKTNSFGELKIHVLI